MGSLKPLAIELQPVDRAQQQFRHAVWILMWSLAGLDRLLETMRQKRLHACHAIPEELLRLIAQLVRLGFDQITALHHTGLQHIEVVQAVKLG